MAHALFPRLASRASATVSLVLTVLLFLWPTSALGQSAFPAQWVYTPIMSVSSVAYSPDGTVLFVSENGGLEALCVEDYSPVWSSQTGVATSIAVSPQGSQICFVNSNGTLVAALNPLYQALYMTDFVVTPTSILGGSSTTGVVTLSRPAPAGGTTVTLDMQNSAHARGPSSFVIPAGMTSGLFKITTTPVSQSVLNEVIATVDGESCLAKFRVDPPALKSLTLIPKVIKGGKTSVATVFLTGPAPAAGIAVTLTTASPLALGAVTVTIPANKNYATVTIPTPIVKTRTTASVVATLGGSSLSAALTIQ
jgi:hypothetical protein